MRAGARTAAAPRRRHRVWLVLLLAPWLGGCAEITYYAQSVAGQVHLLANRRPLAEVVADAGTPAPLRERLELAREVREFASSALALPRDGSYTSYVQLQAPYVVWSVVAAPPLSLTPRTWCFPVAGCVAYRGYFDPDDAQRFAAGLRAAGDDVYVAGVTAYSTLGWFDDPLLSSMLDGTAYDLAAVIFHELAHRRLYLAGDSDFNEAFAVTVEREGMRRWLAARGDDDLRRRYRQALHRRETLVSLVLEWRARLQAVYDSDAPDEQRLARKRELLEGLRAAFAERVRADPTLAGAERWLSEDLNNAKLASVATYNTWVPAFERLLAEQGGQLDAFYAAVEKLAALPAGARAARLAALAAAGD